MLCLELGCVLSHQSGVHSSNTVDKALHSRQLATGARMPTNSRPWPLVLHATCMQSPRVVAHRLLVGMPPTHPAGHCGQHRGGYGGGTWGGGT